MDNEFNLNLGIGEFQYDFLVTDDENQILMNINLLCWIVIIIFIYFNVVELRIVY